MRTIKMVVLGLGTLAALATTAGEAAAQRSARARASVTVVASALPPAMQAEAVTQAVSDTLAHRRLLPSGAQIRVLNPATQSTPVAVSMPDAPASATPPASTLEAPSRRIVVIEFLAT